MKTAKRVYLGGTLLFIFTVFLAFLPVVSADIYDDYVIHYPFDDSDYFVRNLAFTDQNPQAVDTNNDTTDILYETGLINGSFKVNETSMIAIREFMNVPIIDYYSDNNYTISFWMNTTLPDGIVMLIQDADGGDRIEFELQVSTGRIEYDVPAVAGIFSTTNVSDGEWHLITVINNNSRRGLIIDGVYEATGFTHPALVPANIIFGARYLPPILSTGLVDFSNVVVDDFIVWNRSITEDEIAFIYNSGNGRPIRRITENNNVFTSPILQGSSNSISINVTINITQFPVVTASLLWNNTFFPGTTSDTGTERIYSASPSFPSIITSTNVTFDWVFSLSGATNDIYNSTFLNQTLNTLDLDDCSSNTIVLMNLTVVDETSQVAFDSGADDNVTVEVDLTLGSGIFFNQTFTETNPVAICISESLASNQLRLDAQIQYRAFDHVAEFVHFQNFTITSSNIPQNVTLFDLDILNSQEFRITYKDENFLPVPQGLIDITRKYIGEGVFKSVEVPIMDDFGQTIAHLILTDAIYTIIVKKEGQILSTFEDIQAICADFTIGECEINLNAFLTSRDSTDFANIAGMSFAIDYNQTTRLASTIFSTDDGSVALVSLNVTEFTGSSSIVPVCSNSLSSSSGVVTCTVPTSFSNTTIIAQVYKDGQFIAEAFFTIAGQTPEEIFGGTGFIILLIMVITLPLMVIVERMAVVIFAMLGFIMAAVLSIYSGGSVIGWGSSIMWLVIAGSILIWKIGKTK